MSPAVFIRNLSDVQVARQLCRSLIPLIFLMSAALSGFADEPPQQFVPGYFPRWRALVGGTIFVKGEKPLEKGTLLIRDGRVEQIGTEIALPPGTAVFDATGGCVYPAFIDGGNSSVLTSSEVPPQAGLPIDISQFAWGGTPPDHRKGLTPEYEAVSHLDLTEAKLDPYRQSGVGLLQGLPRGRILSGWGGTLLSRGGTVREAVQEATSSSVFQFFRMGPDHIYPATTMGSMAHVRQFFLDARRHQQQQELHQSFPEKVPAPLFDPGYHQIQNLIGRKSEVVVIAETRDEIERAMDFAAEQQLPLVIWGGREANQCLERLKQTGTSLLWTFPLEEKPRFDSKKEKEAEIPAEDRLPEDLPPLRVQEWQIQRWKEKWEVPHQLLQAGIPCLLSSHGLKSGADFLKQSRQLLEHGCSEEELLKLLTGEAGKFPGAPEGNSLRVGSPARLVVLNGDLKNSESAVRLLVLGEWERTFDVPRQPKPVPPPAQEGKPTTPLPDVSGEWLVTIQSGSSPPVSNSPDVDKLDEAPSTPKVSPSVESTARLQLVQVGTELSGKFESEQGNGRVSKGQISTGEIQFTVLIGAGDRSLELNFSGKSASPDSNEWSGVLKSSFGEATWKGKRPLAKPEESTPATPDPKIQLTLDDASDSDPTTSEPQKPDGAAPAPPLVTPSTTPQTSVSQKSGDQVPEKGGSEKQAPVENRSLPQFPTELPRERIPPPAAGPANLLIRGGRIWTGEGELAQGDVLIREGKIAAIESQIAPEEGVPEMDARGHFVMPGIIDTHSHIMISENHEEINEYTLSVVPEVRIGDILWTDDVSEYRAVAGGVTTARILHGSGNVIGGQHAVVKLRLGKTAREHLIESAPAGVKFALGENVKSQDRRFPNSRMGVEAVLIRALNEARQYRQTWERYEKKIKISPELTKQLLPPRHDLRLEALRGVLDQQILIHSHCYRADEILMLIRVAESFGIRIASLQHVLEGYKVAPEIAAHGASCSMFSDWWAFKMEAYDAIPHNAALLRQSGVNVCIKSDDWELIRHLNQEAAKTVRYGMSVQEALQAITMNPARELGLQDRIGQLKTGMDADIAIFRGHPLVTGSRCEKTIIDGRVMFDLSARPTAMKNQGTVQPPPPLDLPTPPGHTIDWSGIQGESFALKGGTLIVVEGPTIPQGTLIVEQGKISALGRDISIPAGLPIIDVTGYTITPGLIDAMGTLGLTEIGKVRETHDSSDSGEIQPDLHAGVAINADSELIPVARAGGITAVAIHPRGGIVSGRPGLMKLSGWTAQELIRKPELGLSLQWPDRLDPAGKKRFQEFQQFWKRGRLYLAQRSEAVPPGGVELPIDARYEALLPLLRGERPLFIEANSRRMIQEVLDWSQQEKIRLVLTGAADAWKVADRLKESSIPVILGPIARAPWDRFDPGDSAYANPGLLEEAGVQFCFRSPGASSTRNLPFEASLAMSYGLSEAGAIRGITLAPATILGLEKEIGSIAVGKQADLVVSSGSLLEPTSRIEGVFIDGRFFAPESKQTRLAERYKKRIQKPVTPPNPSAAPAPTK